ncbi:MAG: hypothetical protein N4A72_03790 [Bacteroidales bacterium]|jgi:hypothetical protein|nr:hypothetical protein [Bacteroidales bacterium]
MQRSEIIEQNLNRLIENITIKQTAIYPLRRVLKSSKILERHAETDPECDKFLTELKEYTDNIEHLILSATDQEKYAFAKFLEKLFTYLKKRYKVTTEGYYKGLFSFISILICFALYIPLFILNCNKQVMIIVTVICVLAFIVNVRIGIFRDKKQSKKGCQI